MRLNEIVKIGMMTALTAAVTRAVQFPTPWTQGYTNAGDILILFAGFYFGPTSGFFIGGVGSAIADIMTGYPFYYFTFIIKGIEGAVAGLPLFKYDGALGAKTNRLRLAFGSTTGALVMVCGYFCLQVAVFGTPKALASLVPNLIQGAAGILGAFFLFNKGMIKFISK